ncbi:MAG: peptidoglycan DD-metalloendopeptidase family protein [Deltaproteobacteria bacterium]|nr:peptidoglycan DD-metalloendopeptidase family protein [Deltaproteobacteria bacterium]
MSPSPEIHSRFMEFMLEHNRPRMDGFKGWVFHPGMLFQALGKWWGDQGLRAVPHEGLDLYSFEVGGGGLESVDQQTQIPAAFAGQVVKIDRDFLGKSIYINHAIYSDDGRQLLSAVGHTVPRDGLKIGQPVAAGEIIAVVAGFPGKKTNLPPHLHLTFAWVPANFRLEQLTWNNLGHDAGISLIDPLTVISPLTG